MNIELQPLTDLRVKHEGSIQDSNNQNLGFRIFVPNSLEFGLQLKNHFVNSLMYLGFIIEQLKLESLKLDNFFTLIHSFINIK